LVVYREYYKKGGIVPQHAKSIVELCGNSLKESGIYEDPDVITPYKVFAESFDSERYVDSVLDGNSFSASAQERHCTLGRLYNDCGLFCRASTVMKNDKFIPIMKQWFAIENDRPHIMWHFHERDIISDEVYDQWLKGRRGEWKCGSKIYFVSSLRWTFEEFKLWALNGKTGKPKDANNHIIGGALKYVLSLNPIYRGDYWKEPEEEDTEIRNYKYVGG